VVAVADLVLGTSQVLEAGVPPPGHLAAAVLRERDSPFIGAGSEMGYLGEEGPHRSIPRSW
jgi:hypothetical protein